MSVILEGKDYSRFLAHGSLGPLNLGDSEGAVRAYLGHPEDEGLRGRVLAYCGRHLQFGISEHVVVWMGLYFHPGAGSPEVFVGGARVPLSGRVTPPEFEELLGDVGVSWRQEADSLGGSARYRLASGVVAVFEGATLQSIQVGPPAGGRPGDKGC